MSILNPRRIDRNRKADFPAVIRPTPATFGLGIVETEDDSWMERYHAHREAELDAVEAWWADGGEDEVRAIVAAYRATDSPNAADDAWADGYCLGREGAEASSIHATHAETMAFRAGHDRGQADYHDERRDEVEATIAAWESVYANDGIEQHERSEAGSSIGHAE